MVNLHFFKPKGRFVVMRSDDDTEWWLVDQVDSMLVSFEKKKDALAAKQFASDYVKKWGDIDLASFPYSLDQELLYDDWPDRERERLPGAKIWQRN